MDKISLNLNYASVQKPRIKMKQKPQVVTKRKVKSAGTDMNGGFSFEFVPNAKVKAIVAKKRSTKLGVTQNKSRTEEASNVVQENVQTEDVSLKKPSKKDTIDTRSEEPKNPFMSSPVGHQNNDSLALNVTTDYNESALKKLKNKLNRDERKTLAKQKKKQNEINHVLTPEELSKGIKQFTNIKPQRKKPDSSTSAPKPKKTGTGTFANIGATEILGQRLVKPVTEQVFTGKSISTLSIHPHSVKNLADLLNITELTKVQQMTIPQALSGRDVLVRSQTGSGKTLAYALPIVENLHSIRPKLTRDCGIQALVIVPTREVGIQTYELFIKLLKPFTWIVPGLLTGGEKRKAEKARLRKGINILVGTPGRLCDHLLHTETFKLHPAKWLVLDEADRLLEMGYERDVKMIVDALNEHKRSKFMESGDVNTVNVAELHSLLLSATLTPAVQKLAGLTLKDPLFIDTSDESCDKSVKSGTEFTDAVEEAVADEKLVLPSTVSLSYVLVPPKLRLVTLSGLIAKECKDGKVKALVFMSTVEMVDFHQDLMNEGLTKKILDEEDEEDDQESSDDDGDQPLLPGLRFFKLHGSMTQQERAGVFKAFRAAKSGVLLATDVAGRGIDVPEVSLVVQYSPPQKISDFVHRVGRTARAGKSGKAVLFLGPTDTDFVRILEDKRIRISQNKMETYLEFLNSADVAANNIQEAASNLQQKFENLINDDKEMHEKSCKAFVSWVRFYSTFPKELKHIFNPRNAHMGHYAKSFGLKEPPTSFAKQYTKPKAAMPTNRLSYRDRNKKDTGNPFKRPKPSETKHSLAKFANKSVTLTTSEFDSGLPSKKRKKF